MTLTTEEARAVEAAVKLWRGMVNEPLRWQEAVTPLHDNHRVYATGYLAGDRDGYKRGVEAALLIAEEAHERSARHLNAEGAQTAYSILTDIRALLAQEPKTIRGPEHSETGDDDAEY